MTIINVKIHFIVAKLYVRRSAYYFDCIACHRASLLWGFCDICISLRAIAPVIGVCDCCMCVTSDLWMHVCVRVSAARAKACLVQSKIFEAHSTHSIICFPDLNWGHLNQHLKLTTCPVSSLQWCIWFESGTHFSWVLQILWMCYQTSIGTLVNN